MSERTYTPELQLVGLYHRHIRFKKRKVLSFLEHSSYFGSVVSQNMKGGGYCLSGRRQCRRPDKQYLQHEDDNGKEDGLFDLSRSWGFKKKEMRFRHV